MRKNFIKTVLLILLCSQASCSKEDLQTKHNFNDNKISSIKIGSYENWEILNGDSRNINENLSQKQNWEVGDTLLIRYEFFPDEECKKQPDIFNTIYTINNVNDNGIPSLKLSNTVLYKQGAINSEFNEIEWF